MANATDLLLQAICSLSDAINREDLNAIRAEVEIVIDMAIPLIASSETESLRDALPSLQRLYAITTTRDAENDRDDAVVGRLSALVTMFTIAAARPGKLSLKQLTEEPAVRKILLAGVEADKALSNQEIASMTSYTEETIARIMPRLRNFGLFTVERDWRRKLNKITEDGRAVAVRQAPEAEKSFDFEAMIANALAARLQPVDIKLVAEKMGARIIESSDQEESGHIIIASEKSGKISYDLTIAKRDGYARNRYTIAHEVAHVVLHSASVREGRYRQSNAVSSDHKEEREAERMAAAILMPEIAILRAIQGRLSIPELAKCFGVSKSALEIRLSELNVRHKVA